MRIKDYFSKPIVILILLGLVLTLIGLFGIFGEFLSSQGGMYLYRDNVWSLYGDISGNLPFIALNPLDGGFNYYLDLLPSGIMHLILNFLFGIMGVKEI